MGKGQKQEGRFDFGRKQETEDVGSRNRSYPCSPKSTLGSVAEVQQEERLSDRHPRMNLTWSSTLDGWQALKLDLQLDTEVFKRLSSPLQQFEHSIGARYYHHE
jgi:hypothetical protein